MREMTLVNNYFKARHLVFKWRYSLVLVHKIALAFAMAGVTGLMAQTKIALPWTPVPITGQTFAVLMAGIFLGRYWGGISQAIYITIGIAGIPWFAGWTAGAGVLLGPTGGYIIGFIFAALFLGHFTDKYIRARSFVSMLGLMLFANFALIHGLGLLHLGIWLSFVKGSFPGLGNLLWMGSIPFIIGDISKIAAAAALAKGITPKQAYNGEVDVDKAKKWHLF